jgi:hypothetical protein
MQNNNKFNNNILIRHNKLNKYNHSNKNKLHLFLHLNNIYYQNSKYKVCIKIIEKIILNIFYEYIIIYYYIVNNIYFS